MILAEVTELTRIAHTTASPRIRGYVVPGLTATGKASAGKLRVP